MQVTIDLPEGMALQVERALDYSKNDPSVGTTLEEIIQKAAMAKLEKLAHRQRCIPRAELLKRPGPGRPPLDPDIKFGRTTAKEFLKRYAAMRDFLGDDDFERVHGNMQQLLTTALNTDDLDVIEYFRKHKPWTLPEDLPEPPALKCFSK